MQRLLLVLLCVLCGGAATASQPKETYHIVLRIKNCADSQLIMGNYYANGTYALDTAQRDAGGRYVFASQTDTLHPGLYFFATGKGKYVEFVVYNEKPFFTFETDDSDWLLNMKVKGSEENEAFYAFHQLNHKVQRLAGEVPQNTDSATYTNHIRRRAEIMDSLKRDFIASNPDRMISKMMLATKDPEIPTTDANGEPLSQRQRWEYFMTHFFDNTPLDDDMMIRTPQAVFYQRVMNYFDEYLRGAPPATIIPYLDTFLDRTTPARETFHWALHTLTEKYLQSNIMVYDELYVHLIQRYYATGKAWWMTPSGIETEVLRANKWERLLVGHEAPELILYDTLHTPHSLHNLPNQYKLLIFWSPACGHCQTVIPQLYERFQKMKSRFDIEGFAILSEPDDETRPKWRKFINEHHLDWINLDGGEANVDWHDVYDITSTPQIYLIDRDNIIRAKKLGADTFEQIMEAIGKDGLQR